jgi:LPS export ABC transporter protein LptC
LLRILAFIVVVFFLNPIRSSNNKPATVTENFKLRYMEGGQVAITLESKRMEDYTHLSFPYKEFPVGVLLTDLSDSLKQTIQADYGIVFQNTDVFFLEGNVVIRNPQRTVKAERVFFVSPLGHIYAEGRVKVISETEVISGVGFDSDDQFANLKVSKIKGILQVEGDEI